MVTQTIYASDYTTSGGTMITTWATLDQLNIQDGHYRRRPLSVNEADHELRQAWLQYDDAAEALDRVKAAYPRTSPEVVQAAQFSLRALLLANNAEAKYRKAYTEWQEILGRMLNNPDCTCAPMGDCCPRCKAISDLKSLDNEDVLEF
jgi:hypothetical protein